MAEARFQGALRQWTGTGFETFLGPVPIENEQALWDLVHRIKALPPHSWGWVSTGERGSLWQWTAADLVDGETRRNRLFYLQEGDHLKGTKNQWSAMPWPDQCFREEFIRVVPYQHPIPGLSSLTKKELWKRMVRAADLSSGVVRAADLSSGVVRPSGQN